MKKATKLSVLCTALLPLSFLTTQSAWGMTWEVIHHSSVSNPNKHSGVLQGELSTNTGDLAATPFDLFNSLTTVETASSFWTFELGVGVTNFDYNSTPTGNLLDGVTDASIGIRGRHLQLPSGHTENLGYGTSSGFSTHFSRIGDSTSRAPNATFRMVASGSTKHFDDHPHKDRFSVSAKFKVGAGVVPTEPFIITPLGNPNFSEGNIKIDARHPGGIARSSVGRTVGSTDSSAAFFASGSESMLIVGGGAIDIVSDTPTHTAGTGSYAGDAVEGIILPEVVGEYAGLTDGVHTFTPFEGFDDIMLTAGDSELIATFEEITIDAATGEGQVHFIETSYIEAFGGVGDNPSDFLGAQIDEHFFDTYDTQTDGLMYNFDATALLASTNNFTSNEFGITMGTLLTGSYVIPTVVPIPATFWLFGSTLGLLGWLRRRASD